MTPAQERLFAAVMREKKTILGVAYRRRVPESDVPDLVQRVLILAWAMIERDALTVDPSRDVRSAVRWWLGRLAFNESVKMHRARAREPIDASLSGSPRSSQRENSFARAASRHALVRSFVTA